LFLRVHARGCQSAMVDLSQLQNHLLIRLFGFFAPDASPSAAKSPRLSSRPTPRHLPAGRNLHGLSRLRPGSGCLWKTEFSLFLGVDISDHSVYICKVVWMPLCWTGRL
jgi:hypothetical protein